MIARASETNPTCFSSTPLVDLEKNLWPKYLRLVSNFPSFTKRPKKAHSPSHLQARYLDNHWSLTKFCMAQFKGRYVSMKKSEATQMRNKLSQAKGYDDVADFVGNSWAGGEVFREVVQAIESQPPREHRLILGETTSESSTLDSAAATPSATLFDTSVNGFYGSPDLEALSPGMVTPIGTQNPEPPGSGAPLLPNEQRRPLPSIITGHSAITPTPTLAPRSDLPNM